MVAYVQYPVPVTIFIKNLKCLKAFAFIDHSMFGFSINICDLS